MIDTEFLTPADRDALDGILTFEELDEIEAHEAEQARELLTGLPARPGTIR